MALCKQRSFNSLLKAHYSFYAKSEVLSKMINTKQTKSFSEIMHVCSAICAILVLLIHAYNTPIYTDVSSTAIYWIQESVVHGIAAAAVPFFFMSSAFFLYSRNKRVKEVYITRFKSLVIPYLLWNTLTTICFAVLKQLHLTSVGLDTFSITGILGGVFLHDYLAPYWYMLYLIVMVAMYPLIRWIISRNKIVCFSFLAFLILGHLFIVHSPSIRIDYSGSIVYYYIGAILGYYYKDKVEKIPQLPKKRIFLLGAISLATGILLFFVCNVWNIHLDFLRDVVTVALIVFAAIGFNLQTPKFLVGLSFMIYSSHFIILESVEEVFYRVFPHNGLWMMVDFFVAPLITLCIIVIGCKLAKKCCPKVYTVLNGNRL